MIQRIDQTTELTMNAVQKRQSKRVEEGTDPICAKMSEKRKKKQLENLFPRFSALRIPKNCKNYL